MQQPNTNGTLISNDYLATQKKLHENPEYGCVSEIDSMLTNPHGFWVPTRPRKLETVCAEK
jgi:hypothetical protein